MAVAEIRTLSRTYSSYGAEYEDGCFIGCSAMYPGRSLKLS
jgi:hypothetical protein